MVMTLQDFKSQAFALYGDIVLPAGKDPLTALYSIGWNLSGIGISEEELAQININLDECSCFGRAVKAAVLVEKHFPNETFFMGEVCEDLLRTILMEGVTQEKWADDTYIAEILQYENPHVVLVWKDQQFDPLFGQLTDTPYILKHPLVIKHSLWEGLYCSYLVSSGMLLCKQSPQLYLQLLHQALTICPEMITPKENQIHPLCIVGRFEEAISVAKSLVGKRKDARLLWSIWQLSQDSMYKNKIVEQYDVRMLNFLNKTHLP